LYDARQAIELAELKGSVGIVYDAAFVADGAIVSSGEEGALRIWAPVQTAALRGDATVPSFSSDGRHVVWGDQLGHVHRWDTATGADRILPGRATGFPVIARASTDGSRIVSAGLGGTVRLYDARTGLTRSVPSDTTAKYAVAIDPSGRHIAVGGPGPLTITSVDGASPHVVVLRAQKGAVIGLAYSPDGGRLASASDDGVARIFDADSGRLQRTLPGHAGTVTSVAFSAQGDRVVTGGADETIRIWNIRGGPASVLYGNRAAVNSAVFNHRGDRVVSAGQDGTVRVWDAASAEPLVVLHQYGVANGADVSPDGRRVVSAGSEGLSNQGVLRVSACNVCGPFSGILRPARSRAGRPLSPAERKRLLTGGP
jgi:WD40 repeat protein